MAFSLHCLHSSLSAALKPYTTGVFMLPHADGYFDDKNRLIASRRDLVIGGFSVRDYMHSMDIFSGKMRVCL